MTGAQASYLKTLSEECGEPNSFTSDLTKAEASKRIDTLKSKRDSRRFRMQTVLRRPRSPLEMSLRGRLSGVRLALDFGIQFGPEKHDDH
jgi:Protein of unknown function (DUF3072)